MSVFLALCESAGCDDDAGDDDAGGDEDEDAAAATSPSRVLLLLLLAQMRGCAVVARVPGMTPEAEPASPPDEVCMVAAAWPDLVGARLKVEVRLDSPEHNDS